MNSLLGIHRSGNATGLQAFYDKLIAAGCPLSCEFSLGSSITAKPPTIGIFRDQRFGAVPPMMYQEDAIKVANDWYNQYAPIWRLNPANYYAYINETNLLPVAGNDNQIRSRIASGVVLRTAADAQYYNAFTVQMQARAHADGFKLCLFEFATGNPQLDLIQHILPACRAGKLAGDVWGQHCYWDENDDQSFENGPLYYKRILQQLPADCVMPFHMTEASPGNGFNTVSNSVWFAEMDRVDHALMVEPLIKSICAFDAGGRDSNIAPYFSLYADLIISNSGLEPPPSDDLTERVTRLEFTVEDQQHEIDGLRSDLIIFQTMLLDHERRLTALDGGPAPLPVVTTATLTATPSTVTQGQSITLSWSTTNAQSISIAPSIGAVSANGSTSITPQSSTTYTLIAVGPNNTATATATVTVTPPIVVGIASRGLQMRADGNSTAKDFECLTVAGLKAAKIMSNTSFDELDKLISLVPASNILFRLFAAGDDPIWRDSQRFFDVHRAWFDRLSQRGVKWIEVGNENNLPAEGGFKNAGEFESFYLQVVDLIRAAYPNKFLMVYPGLSPQPNIPDWMISIQRLIATGKIDYVGVHSYWVDAKDMDAENGGRFYRRFLPLGRPLILTEFANVGTASADLDKGHEYKAYYASLEPQIVAAYCFVSSASDPAFDKTRQTWVRKNSLTAIPAGVA